MSRLYLVRHGEAAAGWGDDADPGLSEAGRAQAQAMAARLAPMGPLGILVSPLRRTRETAAALEELWGTAATVEPAVGEVPSPTNDLAERSAWLADLLSQPMASWPAPVQAWRRSIADALEGLGADTVVVSHFVAIRSVVGDDRYHPDYCSVTVIDNHDGLHVVERGAQRQTVVR
ncbi:MAG: hypothetical protein QOK43_2730 [Acidimicrobiaceae bacterium]|nr:hypothetical protein [Acidimicrobiaceae bacterium]